MSLETDKIYELLTKTRELDLIRISSLDSTTFLIKGWAVTLVTALTGFAVEHNNPSLLCIGIVSTVSFALVDFFYRKVQLLHVERLVEIERYLESKYLNKVEELRYLFKPFDLNLGRNFSRDYLFPVFLVYLVMGIALIFVFLFLKFT